MNLQKYSPDSLSSCSHLSLRKSFQSKMYPSGAGGLRRRLPSFSFFGL